MTRTPAAVRKAMETSAHVHSLRGISAAMPWAAVTAYAQAHFSMGEWYEFRACFGPKCGVCLGR